jgi:hypothetical protein
MAELFVQIVGGTSRESAAQSAELPPGFGVWFLRATHPDPAQRFPNARSLAEELARVLAPDLSIVPWEIRSSMRNVPVERKPRGIWIAAVLGTLAVLLVVLATREAIRSRKSPPATARSATADATVAPDTPEAGGPPASSIASPSAVSASVTSVSASAPAATSSASSAPATSSAPIRRRPPPGHRPNRWGL